MDIGGLNVVRRIEDLEPARRAVAIGTFDGVHIGHRKVIEAARVPGLRQTVVTFDPHPRVALGARVELLGTIERRLELLEELGVEDAVVLHFDEHLAMLSAEDFAGVGLQGRRRGGDRRRRGLRLRSRPPRGSRPPRAARLRCPKGAARRRRLVDRDSRPDRRGRRGRGRGPPRAAGRSGGEGRARRPARRHARLPDRQRRRAANPACAQAWHLRAPAPGPSSPIR